MTDKQQLLSLAERWDAKAQSAAEGAMNGEYPNRTCREYARDIAAMFEVAAALRSIAGKTDNG